MSEVERRLPVVGYVAIEVAKAGGDESYVITVPVAQDNLHTVLEGFFRGEDYGASADLGTTLVSWARGGRPARHTQGRHASR